MKINFTLFLIVIIITLTSCDKSGGVVNNDGDSNTSDTILTKPILTTSSVSLITDATATSGGNITSDGGANIIARGVCWNTSQFPTTANNKTTDSNGTGIFSSLITGLTQESKYYVRAYATNSVGTTYGNEQSFNTAKGVQTITDIDGNAYHSVTIGTQTWMVENLRTTKYRNGETIPYVTDNTSWAALTTGAYCDYNNTPSNSITYGKLYNWYAVNDSRNIAPSGWHVPTDAEWTILSTYLGGEAAAGGKLKEIGTIHWMTPNTGATNETGFKGLPGSEREPNGTFGYIGSVGYYGFWWSSFDDGSYSAVGSRHLDYGNGNVGRYELVSKQYGFSVRCIKD